MARDIRLVGGGPIVVSSQPRGGAVDASIHDPFYHSMGIGDYFRFRRVLGCTVDSEVTVLIYDLSTTAQM